MPRKPLIRSKEFPYHITARCNNKEAFKLPLNYVWSIFISELNSLRENFDCSTHAFVLMPNHFHLLLTTQQDDLGIVMHSFISNLTRKINKTSGRCGRVFGARYHWSIIDNENYYDCALKYVYRNPVKANLANTVDRYPYSTLNFVLEEHFDFLLISPPFGHRYNIPSNNTFMFLDWLNRPFKDEEETSIKSGLKKRQFIPARSGWKKAIIKPDGL